MYKKILLGTVLSMLFFTTPALSASVKIKINSKNTGLQLQPFYVIYLANEKGRFVKTLRQFGKNAVFQPTLQTWYRNAQRANEDIDALSGPSLVNGQTYTETFDIDDTYIDKGYKIILESVSYQFGHKRREITITLDATTPTQTLQGGEHTDSMTVTLNRG